VIIPDANLLIYAYDSQSPYHARAAVWWEQSLSGDEPVGLLHVVVFAFMRITTNPRLFARPLSVAAAARHVRSWIREPLVQLLYPSEDYLEDVLSHLEFLGTAGNLVSDAQIAAFAISHNAVVHTTDSDFLRFPKLKWFNPITGAASGRATLDPAN